MLFRILLLLSLLGFYGCQTTEPLPRYAKDGSLIEGRHEPDKPLLLVRPTQPILPTLPSRDALRQPKKVTPLTVKSQRHVNLIYDRTANLIGFSFANLGSPKTNPHGSRGAASVPRREFAFKYPQRARQGIHMEVYEFAIPNGRDSHTAMHSSLYFFPRRVLPTYDFDNGGRRLKVVLPTGEPVIFDGATKEIVAGVLQEDGPIDNNRNRRARQFAQLSYRGQGVVVRIDQRGEVPESEYLWGKRVPKYAEIQNGDRTCKVRASKLWYQGNGKGSNYFLYPTDEDFRRKILVGECGWQGFQFTDQIAQVEG
ncbi:MAG: hypothetical protein V2J55_04685 [Candidatus Competibacteraceae bacterium]|jgi:hypothetical protein|nr:hypothetical protein [Candidatus Competibacteraceae bacterium]